MASGRGDSSRAGRSSSLRSGAVLQVRRLRAAPMPSRKRWPPHVDQRDRRAAEGRAMVQSCAGPPDVQRPDNGAGVARPGQRHRPRVDPLQPPPRPRMPFPGHGPDREPAWGAPGRRRAGRARAARRRGAALRGVGLSLAEPDAEDLDDVRADRQQRVVAELAGGGSQCPPWRPRGPCRRRCRCRSQAAPCVDGAIGR
jgi:hypothetical protein